MTRVNYKLTLDEIGQFKEDVSAGNSTVSINFILAKHGRCIWEIQQQQHQESVKLDQMHSQLKIAMLFKMTLLVNSKQFSIL